MNLDYLKNNSFFARKAGELGFMWAEEVKKDKYALPSPFEVVDGKLVRTYTLEGVTGWTKFEKNDKK